jgi:hypothetical protein
MSIMRARRAILLPIAAAAVVIAAAILLRRPPTAVAGRASILERRILAIDIVGLHLPDACRMIEQATSVPIEIKASAAAIDRDVLVWLHLKDPTLGALMDALIGYVANQQVSLEFDVVDGRIIITAGGDLTCAARVFDVHDLAGDRSGGSAVDWNELIALWGRNDMQRYRDCLAAEHYIIASGTGVQQEQFAQMLILLRRAQPDGSGPSVVKADVVDDSVTLVRAYDVRDLAPGMHYHGGVFSGNADGVAAVQAILKRGIGGIFRKPPHISYCCGRIIVDGNPADHEKVRSILRQMRSGHLE